MKTTTTDHTPSDAELVKRCQAELPYQTGAFEMLMRRYQDRVLSKAFAMLKNREEARDLTQDIFIKVFMALPRFRSDASFSTWLYAITVNTCLNHLEKMRWRPWWWLSEDIDAERIDARQDESLFLVASQTAERIELRDMIEQVMQTMSETGREALRLRYFEELDHQAIADRLDIRLSAAKMRVKRAREEFIRLFEERTGRCMT